MSTKREAVFEEFIRYHKNNPSERFWQAVRNFSPYAFIYGAHDLISHPGLEDTFYKEGK